MLSKVKISHIIVVLCLMLKPMVGVVYADVTHVNNEQLQALIGEGVAVVDVRRQDEWNNTGIVEGSHLLTFFDKQGRYDVGRWLSELEKVAPKGTPVVLICAAGVRSKSIANLLDARLGYSDVHNVKKGINHWIAKGKPVVKLDTKNN